MMSHSCCTDMHWTNICILPMLPMLLWKKSFSRLCSPLPKGLTQTVGVSGFTGLPQGQMLHLLRLTARLTARMTATCTNECLLPVLWNNVLLWVSRESNIQSCILRLSACFWLLAVLTRYSWKWQRHKCAAVTSELSADEVYWLLNSSRAKVHLWFKGKKNDNARWHFQQSWQVWVNRETFRQEPEVSVLSKCKEPRCYQHDPSRL